jgi:hypothetical protein
MMNDDVPVGLIFKRAEDVVDYIEDRYDIVDFSFVWEDDINSENFGEYVLTLYVDGEPEELLELWDDVEDELNTEGFVVSILPKEKIGEEDEDIG